MNRNAPPRPSAGWLPLLLVIVTALAISACQTGRGDSTTGPGAAGGVAFGDAANGREQFIGYGCGACHRLDGVGSATGRVGPALDDLAEQRMIAGVLPNTPEMVSAWIQDPQEHDRDTGMPDLGVSEEEADDIAAFLLEDG